jgi:2-haloacid dehalogenase
MPQYKVAVFDAYGTLFDVYSITAMAESLFPQHGAPIATLWREKQIEYTRLISLSDPHGAEGSRYYESFWDLTRSALRYTLQRFKLEHSPSHEESLMAQYAKLQAFPENIGVLRQIKDRGIATAILSNGSPEMLDSAVKSAGMESLLDEVISIHGIRQFKTMPGSYALVLERFKCQPAEVLFVSSNAWDALGATWFGFTTVWINRQGLPFETLGPRPHFSGATLETVLGCLT